MKKHDEGYALVLVLVVMVVLCLVATSVLTIALNNLKKQEDSVARMKAKYEAQGKIEEFYANLQYDMINRTIVPFSEDSGIEQISRYDISDDGLASINANGIVNSVTLNPDLDADTGELGDSIYITIIADGEYGDEKVYIICVLRLKSDGGIDVDKQTGVYLFKNPSLSYSSYEVTTVAPGEGGDGT